MKETNTDTLDCRLAVVGTGMAGMAAAFFAARRGIATIQIGRPGATLYASGLFDLYGVTDASPRRLIDNPWQELEALRAENPRHPFGRLFPQQIRSAIDLMTEFMGSAGLPYAGYRDQNVRVITPVGTIKRSYRVPATMWAGVRALAEKAPCLIVDIPGLRGFSARQIVETLKPGWRDLAAASIAPAGEQLPGARYTEQLARGLEAPAACAELAEAIRPHLGPARYVGLPAVLGMRHSEAVRRDLEGHLGRPVFEIPTMPPAATGVRLKEMFDVEMARLGVTSFVQHQVFSVQRRRDGRFVLAVGGSTPQLTVVAENLLLATGRFLGKGLVAERQGIREALMDLPVHQPANRAGWRRERFLDPRGHAINRAGIEVDARFRPIFPDGRVVYENLFAAGTVLAHQDWMRSKSGTGLAVATAYGAVAGMTEQGARTSVA